RVRAADGGAETVSARLVVGADGLRSVVVRRLGLLRRAPRLRKLALVAHVRGLPPMENRGELRAFAGGCVGVAEVGEGIANVSVVLAGLEARRAAGRAEACFDETLRRRGLGGAERIDGVLATGPFDWPVRSAVADGALLVGDAAGYYDPFTGQGIFRALAGAEAAAEISDAALRRGAATAAALQPYERFRRSQRASVALQHLIEAVVARPRLLGAAAARLALRPPAADTLIRVVGDLAPVRALAHPRLLLDWIS
ncbi:MAG: FAD-dependent monooxygenase, partial [Gemmatimonadota bacterium]|nr:FAD-dependent monooxygenase [Gemmatimonadota bacterium]